MAKAAQQKRVLITGGTGTVGQALIHQFSSSKYQTVFQYFSNDERAKEISRGKNVKCWKIDLSTKFSLPAREFDIVINNAALNICDSPTLEVPEEVWRKTLAVNLHAPFKIVQACLPYMVSRKWGRIINISSIYGLRATEGNLPYTVSKHGLSALTKTVAREYAQYGVTCNEICPGPIDSELMQRIAKRESDGTTSAKEFFKSIADDIPAGRFARPREVARAAFFLASHDSAYINGASLPLDGGQIA